MKCLKLYWLDWVDGIGELQYSTEMIREDGIVILTNW